MKINPESRKAKPKSRPFWMSVTINFKDRKKKSKRKVVRKMSSSSNKSNKKSWNAKDSTLKRTNKSIEHKRT
jgi:hypothetical protein